MNELPVCKEQVTGKHTRSTFWRPQKCCYSCCLVIFKPMYRIFFSVYISYTLSISFMKRNIVLEDEHPHRWWAGDELWAWVMCCSLPLTALLAAFVMKRSLEQLLPCKSLATALRAWGVFFNFVRRFSQQQGLHWANTTWVCTDWAPSVAATRRRNLTPPSCTADIPLTVSYRLFKTYDTVIKIII